MKELFTYRDEDIYVHHTRDDIPNPNDFQMHTHDSMELYYFIEGTGQYIVEGNTYTVNPHDILIFRRGEMHMLLISPLFPYERLTIHFNPRIFASVDPKGLLLIPFTERPPGQFNLFSATNENIKIREFIYKDFDMFRGRKENIRLHILSRLLSLLTGITDEYKMKIIQKEAVEQTMSSKMIFFIHEHLLENISLETICAEFFISKSQANRVFKRETGYTIWNYVIIKRLIAARKMLQEGGCPAEVCYKCGFQDYSSFFRSYKSHFKVSPSSDINNPLDSKLIM